MHPFCNSPLYFSAPCAGHTGDVGVPVWRPLLFLMGDETEANMQTSAAKGSGASAGLGTPTCSQGPPLFCQFAEGPQPTELHPSGSGLLRAELSSGSSALSIPNAQKGLVCEAGRSSCPVPHLHPTSILLPSAMPEPPTAGESPACSFQHVQLLSVNDD